MSQSASHSHSESEIDSAAEDEASQQEGHQDHSKKKKQGKRKGRRPLPSKWSRIINVDECDLEEIEAWPLAADLEEAAEAVPAKASKRRKEWAPLFITENFLAGQDEITLDAFALKNRKLQLLGSRVTRLRKQFTEAAEK